VKFSDIRENARYSLAGDTVTIESIEWRDNVRTSVITFTVVTSKSPRRATGYRRSWGLANFQNMASPIKA
jgi:hypothetical protein